MMRMMQHISTGKDRLFLIISAISVAFGLLCLMYVMSNIGVARQWQSFINGSILYVVTTLYGIFGIKKVSRIDLMRLSVVVLLLVFPVFVGYYVFNNGLIPMPERLSPYILSSIILATLSTTIFNWLSIGMGKRSLAPNNSQERTE